jgi:hypothetical protein
MKQALIIFAKNELYGRVKTRLAATTGHEMAMAVYQKLSQHTCDISKNLPVQKWIYYSDYVEPNDRWSQALFGKKVQQGGDLGERMCHAFEEVFKAGAEEVVIVGTDCAELTPEVVMKAFDYLQFYDVVFGPAKDGGYYLIAMKKPCTKLFENISWSTNAVLSKSLSICKEELLSVQLLQELSDIDTEEDWNNTAFSLNQRYSYD